MMTRLVRAVIVFFVIWLVSAAFVNLVYVDASTSFSKHLYRLFTSIEKKRYEDAAFFLNQVSKQFAFERFPQVKNAEGYAALSNCLLQLKQSLYAIRLNEEQIIHDTTRLKLAFDAAINKNGQLYRSAVRVMHAQVDHMLTHHDKFTRYNYQIMTRDLHNRWLLVQPALRITTPVEEVEKTDALFRFILAEDRQENQTSSTTRTLIQELSTLLHRFVTSNEQPVFFQHSMNSIAWPNALAILVPLCLTLLYAIFRKIRLQNT